MTNDGHLLLYVHESQMHFWLNQSTFQQWNQRHILILQVKKHANDPVENSDKWKWQDEKIPQIH